MYVLMVVPSDFPDGDAGAVRDDAFAQIYNELGFDVKLIGRGKKEKKGVFKGTEFLSIYEDILGLRGHLKRFLIDPIKFKKNIMDIIEKYGVPSVIHINDIAASVIRFLIKIAGKNEIPIVHDSVEWYSPCEFKLGKYDKAYILKDRLNKKYIRFPIRVYAISRFLHSHFMGRGIEALRIPVIMDVINADIALSAKDNKIRLIYAGSPANKDYLKEIVQGIERLSEDEKERIVFNIYGVSYEQLKNIVGEKEFSSCITTHGRVTRQTVLEGLFKSDFSVLLRPSNERYTKAGFPTKVVEAMSHGVAMICNYSSDLRLYLRDMENAVIVNDSTPEAFAFAVRRILEIDRDDIVRMKRNARQTAERCFDYRIYCDQVEEFIKG